MLWKGLTLPLLGLLYLGASTVSSSVIQRSLQEELATGAPQSIIIEFKNGETRSIIDNIQNSRTLTTLEGRRANLVKSLKAHHVDRAGAVSARLQATKTKGQEVTNLWISNQISVKGADLRMVQDLEQRFGDRISVIRKSRTFSLTTPVKVEAYEGSLLPDVWGVSQINAPAVWSKPCLGKNVTVGILDTGVDGTHENVKYNYCTKCGFYNPYNISDTVPNDPHGHGTHVCGTVLGKYTGVAPSAQWMACCGCDEWGACEEYTLIGCGQYFLCPCNVNGTDPSAQCGRSPDVINNSWGGPQGGSWFNTVLLAWTAAGIIPIFSAGNAASNFKCSSVSYPGESPLTYAVGAYDDTRTMAYFSGVGPSNFSEGRMKPDMSAPGMNILSSFPGNYYISASGTSMAAPHVTGAFACLFSGNRARSPADIMQALMSSTQTCYAPGKTCGGLTGCEPKNYFVGNGGIDVAAAYDKLQGSP